MYCNWSIQTMRTKDFEPWSYLSRLRQLDYFCERCPVNVPPLAIQPVHNSAPLPPSGSNSHRPIWSNGVVASQQQQQKQHQKAPPTAASNLGLEKLRNNLKADLLSAGSSHSCTSCEPSAMGHQPMAHSFCHGLKYHGCRFITIYKPNPRI